MNNVRRKWHEMITNIYELVELCSKIANEHGFTIEWYRTPWDTSVSVQEALCNVHYELSKALEAYANDDIESFQKEIADAIIRLFHLAGDWI